MTSICQTGLYGERIALDTQKLIYFHHAATYQNFSRAAEECHIAQTAMSRCIANLEDELGFRLFDRSNRKVTLTPAGQCFWEETVDIMDRLYTAQSRAREIDAGFKDFLVIGFGAYERPFLVRNIESFCKTYSKTSISIFQLPSDELANSLLKGKCDIVYGPENRLSEISKARIVKLHTSKNSLAVSTKNPISKLDVVKVDILNGKTFVCPFERGSLQFEQFRQVCAKMGFNPGKVICANTPEGLFTTVELDLALAFVPDHLDMSHNNRLRLITLDCVNTPRKNHLVIGFQLPERSAIKRFLDNAEKSISGN